MRPQPALTRARRATGGGAPARYRTESSRGHAARQTHAGQLRAIHTSGRGRHHMRRRPKQVSRSHWPWSVSATNNEPPHKRTKCVSDSIHGPTRPNLGRSGRNSPKPHQARSNSPRRPSPSPCPHAKAEMRAAFWTRTLKREQAVRVTLGGWHTVPGRLQR